MEIGPFQRQYLDSVENPHASAAQLIARLDALYLATNALMAHLGAAGRVDPTAGPRAIAVMKALHDLDGGSPRD